MGDVQGWITIGTRLNSKQLEKQLNQQKRELAKYAKEEEKLLSQKGKNDKALQKRDEEANLLDYKREQDLKKAKFSSNPETKKYKINEAMQTYENEMIKLDQKYAENLNLEGELAKKIEVNRQQQKLLNDEIDKTSEKLKDANREADFDKIGKNIGKIVKKVGRWALAIVGVRGAYMAVRKAISMVSQYNDQIKADFDYMGYSIAMLFEPFVQKIVNLLKTIMVYVDYIARAWFGLEESIWKSAKDFLDANKNANKLKKTMLGFDEVNKLGNPNEQKAPSFDLPSMGGGTTEVPPIVDFISKNKDLILMFLGAVAGALLAIYTPLSMIQGLGIMMALTILVNEVLPSLLEYLDQLNSSLEDNGVQMSSLYDWLSWLSIAVGFVATAFGAWPVALGAVLVAIVAKLGQYWGQIRKWFQDEVFGWFEKNEERLLDRFGLVGTWIIAIVVGIVEVIVDILDGIFFGVKDIIDGILLICKGDLKGGLTSIFKGIANIIIGIINALGSAINALFYPIRELIVEGGKLIGKDWTMGDIKIPKMKYLASGGIVDLPKTGVAIGSDVRAGESGREGVLPLTNPETMMELGKEIGKWITLNLDITNTIDGRVLNNRLETIKNNNLFARNGG